MREKSTPLFNVTFQISSFYADESLNTSCTAKKIYEASDLDSLFDILDNTDELETIDDTCAINPDINEGPDEINIEYVLIHDESDIEVYRDADFSD